MERKIKTVKEYLHLKSKHGVWKQSGLLDGLSEEDSIALAMKLEEAAQFLLSMNYELSSKVEVIFLPIIARCFHKYKHLVKSIKDAFIFVNSRLHYLDKAITGVDVEAEFCDLMACQISIMKI